MAFDVVTTLDASSVSKEIATKVYNSTQNVQVNELSVAGALVSDTVPVPVQQAALDPLYDAIGLDYPTAQIWKSYNSTSSLGAGSAAAIWTPASGKKIRITSCTISTYGTTSARLFLFFADSGDATYTAGTDQPLFTGSFSPSATVKPGVHLNFPTPLKCETANRILKYQNDAAISIDITVYGFEE